MTMMMRSRLGGGVGGRLWQEQGSAVFVWRTSVGAGAAAPAMRVSAASLTTTARPASTCAPPPHLPRLTRAAWPAAAQGPRWRWLGWEQHGFAGASSGSTRAAGAGRSTGAWRWWHQQRCGPRAMRLVRAGAGAGGGGSGRRGYVTLQELRQGGELRLVYTGPSPETIRVPGARHPGSFAGFIVRNMLLIGFIFMTYPFVSGIAYYFAGMDRTSFERVMLWWLKYREMGRATPPVGAQMVDGQELQKIIDTKIGRPYTMELLEPQDIDEKLKALSERMEGVELLVISGRKNFLNFTIPYISVGIHARIRWVETVKIVGPNGIAHLHITLRTISNPEKRDLSTQLLGMSKRIVVDRVELSFADNTTVVLNEASFGRQKKYPATRLKD